MPNKLIQANDGTLVGASFFAVGSVQQTFLTATEFESIMGTDWVLADGRTLPAGTVYEEITGSNTVPDCRGLFLRTVGGNADPTIGGTQSDRTAVNGLTASTENTGAHTHQTSAAITSSAFGGTHIQAITPVATQGGLNTTSAGSHTHAMTLGGDSETRPVNITVNTYIKVN